MRSPLFALPLGIPMPIQTNIGSSFGLSTVFNAVLVNGMTKSMQPFAPSAYSLPLKILVSTLGLSKIQRPHLVPIHLVYSPLVSTLTISSVSPKTLLSKSFSVIFWPNVAKSTLWALLNGSSEFISLGILLPLWLQSTSISQVLPPIWSRASSANRKILPLRLCHIGPVFLSTQLLLSTDDNNSPAQLCRTEAYQSLVGSIGWLAGTTHPDISAVHSFLSSYSNKPSAGHMKAALYALHYIHSTHDYGISFTSEDVAPMHLYVHCPPSTDIEAYEDAIPPTPTNSSTFVGIRAPISSRSSTSIHS
jgi:hypothetical protein